LFSFYNVIKAKEHFSNNFNHDGFMHFNKWTIADSSDSHLQALIKIKNDEEIYLFVDLTNEGTRRISSIHGKLDIHGYNGFSGLLPRMDSNSLVMKPKFIGDFGHFYLRRDLYIEHVKRVNFLEDFIYELNNGSVSQELMSIIKSYNLRFLIDEEQIKNDNLQLLNCSRVYERFSLCSV